MLKKASIPLLALSLVLLSSCADLRVAKDAMEEGDYAKARGQYETLSRYNFPEAQTNLAIMLMEGKGGPAEKARAIALLRDAADENYIPAILALGEAYEEGKGVPADPAAAADMYKRAAGMGYVKAYFELGQLEEGRRNYPQAENYYQQALQGGYYRAALKLAGLYEKKKNGYKYDPVLAMAWYNYARSHDIAAPAAKIERLKPVLTPAQAAQASRIAQDWISHEKR